MRLRPLLPVLAIVIISGFALGACASEGAQTVSFTPKYDNILYDSSETVVSNGQGQTIHVGANGRGEARRGVIAFDVASNVDRGAKVKAVRLVLNMSRASNDTPQTVSLHRVTTFWGEGASDAEGNEGGGADPTTQDATWIHATYDN
jgi:hypothetical protein